MTIQEAIIKAAKSTHHITRPDDAWFPATLKVSRFKNEPLTIVVKGKDRGYWDPCPKDLLASDWRVCNPKTFEDFMGIEFGEE